MTCERNSRKKSSALIRDPGWNEKRFFDGTLAGVTEAEVVMVGTGIAG